MSLYREIAPYIDGNNLVAPDPVPIPVIRGTRASDNGVLHTSRYLLIQLQNNETLDQECIRAVKYCIWSNGYLERTPHDNNMKQMPDDHYGLFSLLSALDITKPYVKLPWHCLHPMLVYLRGLYTKNPLVRLLSPLMGILIAVSNWKTPSFPTEDSGDRLLTWNIIQGTKSSLLCRLGALVWKARQRSIYGENAVQKIFKLYYRDNPIVKYVKE